MILQASPDRLAQDLTVLARDVGVRLAGTPSERAAADYIIGRARLTRAHVWEEPFPMRARVVAEEQLEVLIGGSWHPYSCSLFSSTPGTNGESGAAAPWPPQKRAAWPAPIRTRCGNCQTPPA
jgi:hypothetical protein